MNKWEIFPHDLLVEDKDGLFIRGHYFSPTFLPNGHLSLIRNSPKDRVVLRSLGKQQLKLFLPTTSLQKVKSALYKDVFYFFGALLL